MYSAVQPADMEEVGDLLPPVKPDSPFSESFADANGINEHSVILCRSIFYKSYKDDTRFGKHKFLQRAPSYPGI